MKRCAILGGGISGLSTAYFLSKQSPEIEIDLYEAESRLGGVIRSEIIDGCVLDAGPDSFLTQKVAGVDLCRELGLGEALVGSNDATRKTFIVHGGELKPFPEGFFLMVPTRLSTLIATPLISWAGKFAALADLFSSPEKDDCSVGDFIERRFGSEILQNIAEPLISGVYGADVGRLSLRTALPQIWELQKKGSLMRSLVGKASGGGSGAPLFTTLSGGMETLISSLKKSCSATMKWKLSTPVNDVEKRDGRWRIGSETYDALVVANSRPPQFNSGPAREIAAMVQSVVRNSAIVVVLCFENLQREGFGWLVPTAERHSVLACTYLTNKFPGRSPANRLLVRLFIGGGQASQWIDRDDTEVLSEARRELKRIAKIDQEALFSRVFRWRNAMPEYSVGHDRKLERIRELARLETKLYFTGNVFAGVGIPDCIRHAKETAERIR
jgi:oxygen-dependent protoporphyrinogen oxidase